MKFKSRLYLIENDLFESKILSSFFLFFFFLKGWQLCLFYCSFFGVHPDQKSGIEFYNINKTLMRNKIDGDLLNLNITNYDIYIYYMYIIHKPIKLVYQMDKLYLIES